MVIYWDSSALLPLVVGEAKTENLFELRQKTDHLITWTLTPIEVVSALCRLHRSFQITESQLAESLTAWNALQEGLTLVRDIEAVKQRAGRLIRIHPLKAADALQLSSALITCGEMTTDCTFASLDGKLRDAAIKEGFQVYPQKS